MISVEKSVSNCPINCLKFLLFSSLLILAAFILSNPLAIATDVDPKVLNELEDRESVSVIVSLDYSPPSTTTLGVRELQVRGLQEEVIDQIPSSEFSINWESKFIGALAGNVTKRGLEALRKNENVEQVVRDSGGYSIGSSTKAWPMTEESQDLIDAADLPTSFGVSGEGVGVAVIDSGIDDDHSEFDGKVMAEHCFTGGGDYDNYLASCSPDDSREGTDAIDNNGHGTAVAAIEMGTGDGVAPSAKVAAVKARSNTATGGTEFAGSDVVEAIEWIIDNQNNFSVPIRTINMSLHLHYYDHHGTACDSENLAMTDAIETATDNGISVFAASGNQALTDKIGYPCKLHFSSTHFLR